MILYLIISYLFKNKFPRIEIYFSNFRKKNFFPNLFLIIFNNNKNFFSEYSLIQKKIRKIKS